MNFKVLILILFSTTLEILGQSTDRILTNNLNNNDMNSCLKSESRGKDLGVCFGSGILQVLNSYDENDSFSLANGVSFVRDEKTPREFGAFLDRDPLDFRGIMEGAGNLISKRSLQWDLSHLYPGLMMRIGPTLANGVLEFVMDPRYKDRTYQVEEHMSTGRLLARNFLLPLLLGFKFQMSTLMPVLLGLILLASKKAFLLSKIAIAAATIFGYGGGGSQNYGTGGYYGGPALSSYTSEYVAEPTFAQTSGYNGHLEQHYGGIHHHRPQAHEYYFKEKSAQLQEATGSPITPVELRDHLERLFVTKNEEKNDQLKDPRKYRDARRFVWSKVE